MVDRSQDIQPGIGVDVGATLAKLAVCSADGELHFDLTDARALDDLVSRIRDLPSGPLALTGCGAAQLDARLDVETRIIPEFDAWGRGANVLLERQRHAAQPPYLLVSVGTGTSMLRVDPEGTSRIGGTALGGGTIRGLGHALTGAGDHAELCELARRGHRDRLDLLIEHVYPDGLAGLPPQATAASFGLLARKASANASSAAQPEDFAAAVIGLVGENVALQSCAVAEAAQLSSVVYGGSSLLDNSLLQVLLAGVTAAAGREAVLLVDGSHAGAVGALALATA